MAKKSPKPEAKNGRSPKVETSARINPDLEPLAVPIGKLKPDPVNARDHSGARSIEAIRASLQEHGQQKPVVALADGTVIAGNGTLKAALELGWDRLAVVRFADAKKAREYAIADNRSAELSTWNLGVLIDQLQGMDELQVASAGFSVDELEVFLDQHQAPMVVTRAKVEDLKPHPRNYQVHPEDQLNHLAKSIEAHGFYRNIVVARDNTILAGHGVVQAAKKLGRDRVPIIRLDLDPNEPRALKVLTSDNEISNLAETDDIALTQLLKDILGSDPNKLEGTGFDEMQLAALTFVTRPSTEMATIDDAAGWVGMPEFESTPMQHKAIVSFQKREDRDEFLKLIGAITVTGRDSKTCSLWWPDKPRNDQASVKFVDSTEESAEAPAESA